MQQDEQPDLASALFVGHLALEFSYVDTLLPIVWPSWTLELLLFEDQLTDH